MRFLLKLDVFRICDLLSGGTKEALQLYPESSHMWYDIPYHVRSQQLSRIIINALLTFKSRLSKEALCRTFTRVRPITDSQTRDCKCNRYLRNPDEALFDAER